MFACVFIFVGTSMSMLLFQTHFNFEVQMSKKLEANERLKKIVKKGLEKFAKIPFIR